MTTDKKLDLEKVRRAFHAFLDTVTLEDIKKFIAKDSLSFPTKLENSELITQPNNLSVKVLNNYLVTMEDWEGEAPEGKSIKVDGHWYYDFKAANSIKFPTGFYLPSLQDWKRIRAIAKEEFSHEFNPLKLRLNGFTVFRNGTYPITARSIQGHYWSSDKEPMDTAYSICVTSNLKILSVSADLVNNMYSVRCIKRT